MRFEKCHEETCAAICTQFSAWANSLELLNRNYGADAQAQARKRRVAKAGARAKLYPEIKQGWLMGRFFTSFSDLLTPGERERLAALKKSGIPQHVRDDLHNTADDYWKNFKLANFIAANICLGEPLERQQEVTALLEVNQKKSRRKKAVQRVVVLLLWGGAFYALVKLVIWEAGRLF